jgi:hypothetical protein
MIAESELTVTQVRDARANVIEQMFANGAAQEADESHRLTAQEENPYQSSSYDWTDRAGSYFPACAGTARTLCSLSGARRQRLEIVMISSGDL